MPKPASSSQLSGNKWQHEIGLQNVSVCDARPSGYQSGILGLPFLGPMCTPETLWYLDAVIYKKTLEAGNYENIKIRMVGSRGVCHSPLDCAASSRGDCR